MIRKARNIGIILGNPEESTSTQAHKNTTGKTKVRTVNIAEQKGLTDQIKKRKACWKTCENTWKVNIQERCLALSDSTRRLCKKELFKERISCVSQNCRAITQ